MLDLATREWRMSPQMQIRRPFRSPNRSRRVSMSSSPCVGCSCVPSPALMTLDSMRSARNCAAPEAPCRMTTMSMRMASRFRAVSTSVSPLLTLDPDDATFTVSAERRFSANSEEMRVRGCPEDKIDDRRAAERGHLLDRPLADLLEGLGGVEDE